MKKNIIKVDNRPKVNGRKSILGLDNSRDVYTKEAIDTLITTTAPILTLDNGLMLNGTIGKLGGTLTADTTITQGAFDLTFSREDFDIHNGNLDIGSGPDSFSGVTYNDGAGNISASGIYSTPVGIAPMQFATNGTDILQSFSTPNLFKTTVTAGTNRGEMELTATGFNLGVTSGNGNIGASNLSIGASTLSIGGIVSLKLLTPAVTTSTAVVGQVLTLTNVSGAAEYSYGKMIGTAVNTEYNAGWIDDGGTVQDLFYIKLAVSLATGTLTGVSTSQILPSAIDKVVKFNDYLLDEDNPSVILGSSSSFVGQEIIYSGDGGVTTGWSILTQLDIGKGNEWIVIPTGTYLGRNVTFIAEVYYTKP